MGFHPCAWSLCFHVRLLVAFLRAGRYIKVLICPFCPAVIPHLCSCELPSLHFIKSLCESFQSFLLTLCCITGLLLFLSERSCHSDGSHEQTGVPAELQQKCQAVFLFVVFLCDPHPRPLHGLPPLPLLSEFLSAGQGWSSVGLQFRSFGVQEPASPGEPDLHQPAEQRVQRLASVEVRAVLQDLHPEDPAADARLPTES